MEDDGLNLPPIRLIRLVQEAIDSVRAGYVPEDDVLILLAHDEEQLAARREHDPSDIDEAESNLLAGLRFALERLADEGPDVGQMWLVRAKVKFRMEHPDA